MGRVRDRIGDKRVLGLVKAFLKAGILGEDGGQRDNDHRHTRKAGSSHRCWPTSPCRCSTSTSPGSGGTAGARTDAAARDSPTIALIRYADDFVVMVAGDREHAESVRSEVAAVLAPIGLRLSEEKTRVVHIDEGFDFLGWRIQRHQKRGGIKRYVYTYPAKKALASIVDKVTHDHPAGNEPAARRPAASAEPGAAGLDQLLPSRGVPARPSPT